MLAVELLILLVGMAGTQELQVRLADDVGTYIAQQTLDGGLLVYGVGVLAGFVITVETTNLHAMQSLQVLDIDIEIACHVGGKVVLRHLEEQLVLVGLVRIVGKEEHEAGIAFRAISLLPGGIPVVELYASAGPYVVEVEFAPIESSAGIHAVDDHTCHLAQTAVGILADHFLEVCQAALDIAVVQLAEAADEEEFITVCPIREAVPGYLGVPFHLVIFPVPESLIGERVERIFYLHPPLGILCIVWVGKEGSPLAFRVFCLQFLQIGLCHLWFPFSGIEQI